MFNALDPRRAHTTRTDGSSQWQRRGLWAVLGVLLPRVGGLLVAFGADAGPVGLGGGFCQLFCV